MSRPRGVRTPPPPAFGPYAVMLANELLVAERAYNAHRVARPLLPGHPEFMTVFEESERLGQKRQGLREQLGYVAALDILGADALNAARGEPAAEKVAI